MTSIGFYCQMDDLSTFPFTILSTNVDQLFSC